MEVSLSKNDCKTLCETEQKFEVVYMKLSSTDHRFYINIGNVVFHCQVLTQDDADEIITATPADQLWDLLG